MTEHMVEVPVSLIERAKDALLEVPPSSRNADIYGDLSALLSQSAATAQPVSIADMAPGTTLELVQRWTVVRDPSGGTFLHRDNNGYAQWLLASDVDPSTIRDVTPPAATPEEGDRG